MPLPAIAAVAALAAAAHLARRGSRSGEAVSGQADAVPDEVLERFAELVDLLQAVQDEAAEAASLADEELEDVASTLVGEMLEFQGFRSIGHGGGRVVVDLGRGYAAKVASWEGGARQNRQEIEVWSKADADLRSMLVPILAHDESRAILVPKVVPLDVAIDRAGEDRQDELYAAFRDESRNIRRLPDFGPDGLIDADFEFNWGLLNGELKLLDYGQ